ncbi:unnamed protein product [Ceutorhynchus assimilis]|uniref:Uncharacterized protein n=1 Tax=Ceutorhynchus assimilis TaxID=467358 RepID=A0A9N9MWI4_9CUCU|nr:unnamed protein product [Ceutorhynchus assimilis]
MQKVYISLLVILSAVAVRSGHDGDWCEDCRPCPREAIICPKGTHPGYADPCQCCLSCVISEGDKCPWKGPEPPSGPVECEDGTECCDWRCSRYCDK